jgi:hypothetical protein
MTSMVEVSASALPISSVKVVKAADSLMIPIVLAADLMVPEMLLINLVKIVITTVPMAVVLTR